MVLFYPVVTREIGHRPRNSLLSPGSYTSEICRAEHLRALRKGKCVIPVLALAGSDATLHLEAKNYRNFTCDADYSQSFQALLADIHAQNRACSVCCACIDAQTFLVGDAAGHIHLLRLEG